MPTHMSTYMPTRMNIEEAGCMLLCTCPCTILHTILYTIVYTALFTYRQCRAIPIYVGCHFLCAMRRTHAYVHLHATWSKTNIMQVSV